MHKFKLHNENEISCMLAINDHCTCSKGPIFAKQIFSCAVGLEISALLSEYRSVHAHD